MKKSDVERIIKEEMDRMAEMAMSPDERRARRRELAAAKERAAAQARIERARKFDPQFVGSAGPLAGPMSDPDPVMGFQQYTGFRKVAFIEPGFQKAEGIYTPQDAVAAVREGRAKIWSAGMIGSALPSAYTIVPPDAKAQYDEVTGDPGYPYVYSEPEKDPETGRWNFKGSPQATVYTGSGRPGSLGGPRRWPSGGSDYILDKVEQFFTSVEALPILTLKKEQAEDAAEEMSAEGGAEPMSEPSAGDFDPEAGYVDDPKSALYGKPMKRPAPEDEPLNENRWAKMAGILRS